VRKPRWRRLAATALAAGLLAAGAGGTGLALAGRTHAPPRIRLAARPSLIPVPGQRATTPGGLPAARQPARPVSLSIPAIGVTTNLVNLGLEPDGSLQVPSSATVAGWYTGSPRPGAVGSSIIAGHVDSRTGPAVFYWLHSMRPGELVYIRRAGGTLATFSVTRVQTYEKKEFPTAEVYGPEPDAELRLITCGGTFDPRMRSYLSNVVVYARLVR
jgi:sortase (surface protein transpeptidase)